MQTSEQQWPLRRMGNMVRTTLCLRKEQWEHRRAEHGTPAALLLQLDSEPLRMNRAAALGCAGYICCNPVNARSDHMGLQLSSEAETEAQ